MVKSGDNLPWLENEVFLELSESHSPSPESTRVNSFSSLDFPDSSLSSGISSKHDKSRDLRHDPWKLGGYTILGIYHHSVVDLDIRFTKSLFVLFAWAVLRLHCKWVWASASTWPDCGNHFPPCPGPGPLQWRAAVSPSCVCSTQPARSHCPASTMLTIQLSRQPVKGTELF